MTASAAAPAVTDLAGLRERIEAVRREAETMFAAVVPESATSDYQRRVFAACDADLAAMDRLDSLAVTLERFGPIAADSTPTDRVATLLVRDWLDAMLANLSARYPADTVGG